MANPVPLAEIWRGPFLESVHLGHAVIVDGSGQIVESWGDPSAVVLPRSSSKMIQALPLIETGAAAAYGLGPEHLALACASHNGAAIHTDRVRAWLDHIGMTDDDFRCGPQMPDDPEAHKSLLCSGTAPCQCHNNCSGKHSGFLTVNKHIGGDPDYVDPAHPLQRAVLEAFEDLTDETSPGYGIDGCSAPNFASSLLGMARAMAFYATARDGQGVRASAAARLRDAMVAYPELVAGEGRACTELMRAMDGRVALKTGAEAFFVAIVPEKGWGIALKIADGSTRGSECAIASILVRHGLLAADHPATRKRMNAPILNRRGLETGMIRPAAGLTGAAMG